MVVQAGSTSVTSAAAWSRSRGDTFANVVRKQWKCCHVECSARYNWRIVALFRELMKSVDHAVRLRHQQRSTASGVVEPASHLTTYLNSGGGGGASNSRLTDAFRQNSCVIL